MDAKSFQKLFKLMGQVLQKKVRTGCFVLKSRIPQILCLFLQHQDTLLLLKAEHLYFLSSFKTGV